MKLLKEVEKGARYAINLKQKSLKIDGNVVELKDDLIKPDDLRFYGIECNLNENCWTVVEELFRLYQHSSPSEHYKGNQPYFKALDVEELGDDEIAYNTPRNIAQALLEGYVLLASLNGWLCWGNENHWFWQSDEYPECIVLREWVI